MPTNHFLKAFVLTLGIVIGFVICWEYYWRSKGFPISYNDDNIKWAAKRNEVYRPADQTTVFIGGSRIKFDVDISTWRKLTGEQAVQLALVGTSPRPILQDLANDSNFKGKVIIDVTEPQFFEVDSVGKEKIARGGLEYFRGETPAQKASSAINNVLESNLVFLEEGKFGLDALLDELELPNRAGVSGRKPQPKEFWTSNDERQSIFTPMFLADTAMQNKKFETWAKTNSMNKSVAISGEVLEAFFKEIKTYIDKIRSRGGLVVFVRLPSSGLNREREKQDYPRTLYWDRLLGYTQTPGFHYSDYPETAKMICPEGSHLTPSDAVTYTSQLINLLKKQEGLNFFKN